MRQARLAIFLVSTLIADNIVDTHLEQVGFDSAVRFSREAYSKIEVDECRRRNPVTGVAILACHAGLAGYSAGKSCLYGVTYLEAGGTERRTDAARVCTLDCTDARLSPKDDPCAATAYKAFQDKIAYQTYAHLPVEKKAALRAWYVELAYILRRMNDEKQYAAAGADPRRNALENLIAVSVADDMLPLAVAKLGGRPNFKFPRVYELSTSSGKALAMTDSFGLIPDLTISLSAFAHKVEDFWVPMSPDFLAAVFIHEFIHASKPRSLMAEAGAANMATALSEVMAYSLADRHPLFPYLQATSDREAFLKVREENIVLFKKLWSGSSASAKKEVVNWAWGSREGQADWMRAEMYFHPADNDGIWGTLCAFNGSRGGRGPCGMEIRE